MDEHQQQQETLSYFDRMASDWRQKAEGRTKAVNIIAQRNACVLREADRLPALRRTLDVGCGTGELVCALAERGAEAIGVDFAAEMIAHCQELAARKGVGNAQFIHGSIFEYAPAEAGFDLISANGFIEYISAEQLAAFLKKAHALLAPGGVLVVGSRNRLFNLFSLNAFTRMEMSAGAAAALLEEAAAIAECETMTAAIAAARALKTELPPMEKHPDTGIGVATRHQYTPAELIHSCEAAGLRATGLAGVHYHGLGVRLARERSDLHAPLAELVFEQASETPSLLPGCSSIMVTAQR